MAEANPQTATNGSVRVPFDQRDGATSDVFFTRDLSPEGLRRAVAKVAPQLTGKIAIKLHTGEKDGPNIIPFNWVKALVSKIYPMPPSWKPTPTMKATATPPNSIAKPSPTTAGHSAP